MNGWFSSFYNWLLKQNRKSYINIFSSFSGFMPIEKKKKRESTFWNRHAITAESLWRCVSARFPNLWIFQLLTDFFNGFRSRLSERNPNNMLYLCSSGCMFRTVVTSFNLCAASNKISIKIFLYLSVSIFLSTTGQLCYCCWRNSATKLEKTCLHIAKNVLHTYAGPNPARHKFSM